MSSVSKRTRFEVFKRDKFTCQYCGKKAPDVVLQCDHIEPKSKGGPDGLLNLITACEACNGGKGAVRLSDDAAVTKQREQLERLQERQEQIEMMIKWQKNLSGLEDSAIEQIAEYWCDLAHWCDMTEAGKRALKTLVRKYGEGEVMEAMRLAGETYFRYESHEDSEPTDASTEIGFSKLGGICRVRADSVEKPYLADMFYVRAILRNRRNNGELSYVDERRALELLEAALTNGVSPDDLKAAARDARTWTAWKNEMCEYAGEGGQHG